MNVLSLFDGMSCGQIALARAGIQVKNYIASEIDKYAIQITQKNYPKTFQVGDVTKLKNFNVDLLLGGSPCQGFSFSGKQMNFGDPRSVLFFEYVRLLEECKPRWFLLENTPMKEEYKRVISDYLHVYPVEINSSLFSAQNRKRLYWTNIPIKEIVPKNITFSQIREYGVTDPTYYYSQVTLDWVTKYSQRTGKEFKVLDEKCPTIVASFKLSGTSFFGVDDIYGLRFMTPLECERAQTVPDNYTVGVSNTQRYRMLGNGWTVDVIAHILKGILSGNEIQTGEREV